MTDEQARALAIAIMERPEGYDPALLIGEERAWYDAKLPLILAALLEAKAQGMEEAMNKPGQHHIDDIGQLDTVSWIKGYLTCKNDFIVWCRARAAAIREGKP